MSAPRDLDEIDVDRRYAPRKPWAEAAENMLDRMRELDPLPAGSKMMPPLNGKTATDLMDTRSKLSWVAAELKTLTFGDFMEFCTDTESDPQKVWDWATNHGK